MLLPLFLLPYLHYRRNPHPFVQFWPPHPASGPPIAPYSLPTSHRLGTMRALRLLAPAAVTGATYLALIALFVFRHHYGALDFVHLGTIWTQHDPTGGWGYDGQFYWQIARDPLGAAQFLDNPPYRYQRILFPIVVRLLAFGQ